MEPTPHTLVPDSFAPLNVEPSREPKGGVFVGRFGLRAGWGILLYLVFCVVLAVLGSLGLLAAQGKLKSTISQAIEARQAAKSGHATTPKAAAPKATAHEMSPGASGMGEALQFAGFFFAAFLMAKIERRRLGVYGIGRYGIANFLPGAFWGLATLSLLVLVLRSRHLLVFDERALFGKAAFLFGIKWLIVFFFVGCLEEYLFRGYVQFTLTRGFIGLGQKISAAHFRALAFFFASIITSFIFFKAHTGNAGENGWGLFMVFLAGVVFAYALWRTGSLWWGIGFHMAWDWAQSFLYGVPDSGFLSAGRLFHTHPAGNPLLSGGTDGPEGSLFVIPTMLLVLVILRFTRPGTQPPVEQRDAITHTALA